MMWNVTSTIKREKQTGGFRGGRGGKHINEQDFNESAVT